MVQYFVIFFVRPSLLIYSSFYPLLLRQTYFMHQYLVNFPFLKFFYIWLPLKNINKALLISQAWFIDCKCFCHEVLVHKIVHIKNTLHLWKVINFTPRFSKLVCRHLPILLFFAFLCINSLFKPSKLALILSPVKYLNQGVSKLILMISPIVAQLEHKFLNLVIRFLI